MKKWPFVSAMFANGRKYGKMSKTQNEKGGFSLLWCVFRDFFREEHRWDAVVCVKQIGRVALFTA